MKRNRVFTSLLLSTGILLSAPAAMAATPLSVSINESRYVQEAGLSRVAVGNPAIADVQLLSAREFLLVGKQAGSTSLLVWNANGRQEYIVTVTGDDSQTLMGKLPMGVFSHSGGIPVCLIAGRVSDRQILLDAGFFDVVYINPSGIKLEDAMRKEVAKDNISRTVRNVMQSFLK